MPIDWLYRTTLEISLLIGLVLLIRPVVRTFLGAQPAYWLWFIPLLRVLIPERLSRPATVLEAAPLPGGQLDIAILPNPDVLVLPSSIPLVPVWVAGIAVWVGFRIFMWVRFQRQLRAFANPCDAPAPAVALLPERLRSIDARYFSCSLPGAPFVSGLMRPAVYLPEDFQRRFSESEQKCVIHHELMHFLRRDLWMQIVWELLRALFWFNPIVHIAAIALREDQEFACDQAVLASCPGEERFHYARALVVGAGPYLLPPAIAFFGKPKARILMIEKHRESRSRTAAGLLLCGLIGVLTLTKAPLSMAQGRLDEPLTLSFQSLPIEAVVQLLSDFVDRNITGVEQIEGPLITIRLADVAARDALMQLLNCVGYTFEPDGEDLAIVPLGSDSDASFDCVDVVIEQEQTV